MTSRILNVLLADDDADDCTLFKEALQELTIQTRFRTEPDGVQLMKRLTNKRWVVPDVLFLDLNMPRLNGYECLKLIKGNDQLKHLPVVIFSTAYDQHTVDRAYEHKANFYIRKPTEFRQLKKVIFQVLNLISQEQTAQPSKKKFMLTKRSTQQTQV